MRHSLTCQSSKAIRNIAKVLATRSKLKVAIPNYYEDHGTQPQNLLVSLPRVLGPNYRLTAENALEDLLNTQGETYNRIWESYLALRQYIQKHGGPPVPYPTMQRVLQRCTPNWASTRKLVVRVLPQPGMWKRLDTAVHSHRLRTVLSHMRESGQTPTISDYNYVLQYMAAAGHVRGASALLKEIDATEGVKPSAKTMKHVLQACVFLLEIEFSPQDRNLATAEATNLAYEVIRRVTDQNIDLSRQIVELVLRIVKEDGRVEQCERILRAVCAFDINKPDRMPEEFAKRLKEADESNEPLPKPLPISTSMFTTMMVLYGRRGDISKMVTLFEVLTNPYPLPSNLPSPSSDWWDNEEEYDVPNPVVQTPLKHRPEYIWEPPRASPNSATFAFLLRYLSWAGQRVLCEHYMLIAEEYDKAETIRLRKALSYELARHQQVSSALSNADREIVLDDNRSLIPSPRFLITPLLFMPVFAYANRQRVTQLMRWIRYHLHGVIQRRERELEFFKKSYESLPSGALPTRVTGQSYYQHEPYQDFSGIVEGTERQVPLDLKLHIELVETSLVSFKAMLERAEEVIARLTQRTVERLTRRVWNNKDVYIPELERRVVVGRDEWQERVQWKMWAGPVTGTNLGRMGSEVPNGVIPNRWLDERMAARIQSKNESGPRT
ncbi:hypothetical protein FRC18_009390 [Serendipita sp. 400]|nr:hypothetical protein FRC18_009390 [Serendipita sp. 400]